MSRLLKKYSLKYQYLKLEHEDTKEYFSTLEVKWKEIFGKYFSQIKTEIWINEETGEIRDTPPGEEEPKVAKPDKLKKLYRKASTKAHPDKGGTEEEFDRIKSCYENNDFLGLLSYASEKNINVEVDDEDEELLKASVFGLEKRIQTIEASLIWNFFKGNNRMKVRVIRQLEHQHNIKIDEKEILNQLES